MQRCQWRTQIVGDMRHQFTAQPIGVLQGLYLLVYPPGHGLERGAEAVDVIPPLGLQGLGSAPLGNRVSPLTLLEGVHRGCEFPEPAG